MAQIVCRLPVVERLVAVLYRSKQRSGNACCQEYVEGRDGLNCEGIANRPVIEATLVSSRPSSWPLPASSEAVAHCFFACFACFAEGCTNSLDLAACDSCSGCDGGGIALVVENGAQCLPSLNAGTMMSSLQQLPALRNEPWTPVEANYNRYSSPAELWIHAWSSPHHLVLSIALFFGIRKIASSALQTCPVTFSRGVIKYSLKRTFSLYSSPNTHNT
jgi:hypothetical protein